MTEIAAEPMSPSIPPTRRHRAGRFPGLIALAAVAIACGGADPGASDGGAPTVNVSEAARSGAASLAAAPSPAPAGASLQVTGCGYTAGLSILGQDQGPAGTRSWSAVADASGCLAAAVTVGRDVGTHTLKAYQQLKRGQATLLGQTSVDVVPAPLGITSESYSFRWDATKACLGEDDHADWTAAGSLAPGESFTFAPRHPDCNDPRAVMVKVTAGTDAQLQVSTVVPENDYLSNERTQKGKTIVARTSGGVARLCMFPNTSFTAPAGYAITVTNVGSTTATSVDVSGKDYNDWPYFYWSACLGADADGDGWSDSYEHTLAQLVYPSGNFNSGALPAGTDYLRACGTSSANDEFDAWPVDLDDDGVVTQVDADLVAAHVGEGNGIAWSRISPNPGIPENYWNHVGDWNRFDLDADGWVTSADVDLVKARLGARCGP